jgi:hypothetical protein
MTGKRRTDDQLGTAVPSASHAIAGAHANEVNRLLPDFIN